MVPVTGSQTMAFLMVAISRVIQAYNMQSEHSLFKIGPFTNHKLNGSCLISFLLVTPVQFTPLRTPFGLVAPRKPIRQGLVLR